MEHPSNDMLVKEKDGKIAELQVHIHDLEERIKELSKHEVSQKILVQDDHLPTLIDLIRQLRDLKLRNGRKLLMCDHDSPYYKLIAKYFSYEGKDVSSDTVRNYFVRKKEEEATKGSKVRDGMKLFRIVPVDEALA